MANSCFLLFLRHEVERFSSTEEVHSSRLDERKFVRVADLELAVWDVFWCACDLGLTDVNTNYLVKGRQNQDLRERAEIWTSLLSREG